MRVRVLTIGLLAIAPSLSLSQETVNSNSAVSDRPVYEIAMKEDPDFPSGKVAKVQHTVDSTGDRYQFKDTKLLQPISVAVLTKNPGDQVHLRVVKSVWNSPEREADTQGGLTVIKFRTYDGFRLWITADTPTLYQLVVWIGDEILAPLPSVTMPMSAYLQGHPEAAVSLAASSAVGSWRTWLACGLGLGAAFAAAAFFIRRKPS